MSETTFGSLEIVSPGVKAEKRRRPGDSWRPVDLSVVLADGYEPPMPDVGCVTGAEICLFYRGRINAIFGDSGGGKTWFALHVMAQHILAGEDVILVDYEDHPASQVARLEQMGVAREAILDHLIYIQPSEKWSQQGEHALAEALEGRDVAVAVLDSTGEALAVDGVSPNADEEVAKWFRGTARFLAQLDAAVILLDHTVKARENSRNTEFASGSQRKRAAINGSAYFLDVITAPSKCSDGQFKLLTRKDRFGWRKHGSVACEVLMTNVDDGQVRFQVSQPAETTTPTGQFRPTWYMKAVSEFLESADEALSKAKVVKGVGRKYAFVAAAIDRLAEEGFVTITDGARGAKLVKLVKPYVELDDSPF
jgi:KaiC/GvpD/RAD55 family RecA-like ATPase